jgi:hypothetical protein
LKKAHFMYCFHCITDTFVRASSSSSRMPTLDPITDIQKASTTAAARGVIFVAIVDGRADGDGSGVYAACGGFVSFGEDAGFAVEELLLGVGCHG